MGQTHLLVIFQIRTIGSFIEVKNPLRTKNPDMWNVYTRANVPSGILSTKIGKMGKHHQ